MERIISYLNQQLTTYMIEKKQLESEFESKKISATEVERTINRLMDKKNDTDAIFRANIANEEFQNNEIQLLNNQLQAIKDNIELINKRIQSYDVKIAELNELLQYTRNISLEYNEMKNSVVVEEVVESDEKDDINPKEDDSSFSLVENLKNISSRIDTALKIEKMDRERAKMELNLARVKLLFCIDDLEKK